MQAFNLVRLIAFGVALGFSLIILGIGANFVSTLSKLRFYTGSSVPAFSVATAVLTFIILIPVLVIEFLRKGAATSLVATELGFVGFLWVLWLACAGNSTAFLGGYTISDCSFFDSTAASFCQQYQALQAFSWLNWLILFFYWIALLVFAVLAHSRGNKNAFMLPTVELVSSVPKGGNAAGEPKIPPSNYPPSSIPPGTYPPQGQYPQQSFTPSQYPQQGYTPGAVPPQGQAFQQSFASSPAPPPAGTIQV